jgi:large subunit ribosomal protein L25
MISVPHNELAHSLENEGFYANLLNLKLDGKTQQVVLKDLQRHPAKPFILHVDFQRIQADEKIRLHVPIHFINESSCPGIKAGGQASHIMSDMEITCLPKDLPEFIEVDMSDLEMGITLHATEVKLPEGVDLITHEGNEDPIVLTIHTAHTTEVEPSEEEGIEGGEEPSE